MTNDDSVSLLIERARQGDEEAAGELWKRYFHRLVHIARRKLDSYPRRVADEEDVAISAFHSFCRAAREGRFPDLHDRDSLWRLLVRMTARKAVDLIRHQERQKRKVLGESVLGSRDVEGRHWLAMVIGESPSPEFAEMVSDQCRFLLESLGDDHLRALALAKMQGYSNEEIARQSACSVRTVERQLHLIRRKWEATGELH